MASTILNRTPSSTGNRKKWTLSMWIKNSNLKGQGGSSYQRLYQADNDNEYFRFTESTGKLLWLTNNGSSGGFLTTRVFRDSNCWYHLVLRIDTTLGTAGDRSRLYVNGVEETAFDTENQLAQDYYTYSNCISKVMQFGGYSTSDQNFNGCMSHVHMCDGYSYAPTEFGETDSTTGEWKIKTSPSVSYGTNGFFILKDGNSVTDQSGQSNNLTVSGTLTKTEDCPSNVFATWNPLMPNSITYSNGNTTCTQTADANYRNAWTTIATPTTGKFYAEFKAVSGFSAINKAIGYIDISQTFDADIHIEQYSIGGSYGSNGRASYNQTIDSSVPTFTDGDIIGLALDLDNGKAYYHKNGTYINSGNPTTGSNGYTVTTGKQYTFSAIVINQGGANVWSANFGNGYFGTTAVASAGTNASGIGIFEYDVPTGYTALSTKGLNE